MKEAGIDDSKVDSCIENAILFDSATNTTTIPLLDEEI